MIVAVALECNGMIFTMPPPNRHHNLLHWWSPDSDMEVEFTQGFITDEGIFLDRKKAYLHCIIVNQPLVRRNQLLSEGKDVYNGDKLFSEDLW